MDININLNVNSQPLTEMSNQLNQANSGAQNLNNTLKDKAPESQITKNGVSIGKTGRAMNGLRQAVGGFDKLVGAEIGGAVGTVGSLGKTFMGLGKVIPVVTGTFRALGAALMANPIIFIATIILGVVAAVGYLMDGLGLLQPIFDAIGSVVNSLIAGLKSLTNWLGLTSDAAEKAKQQTEGYNSSLELLNSTLEKTLMKKDRDIAIAKAQGATLEKLKALEDARTQALKDNLKEQLDATQEVLRDRRRELNGLNATSSRYKEVEKEIEELKEKRTDIENRLFEAETERRVREIEYINDVNDRTKKQALEEIKLVEEKEKLKILEIENSDKKQKDYALKLKDAKIAAEEAIFNKQKENQVKLKLSDLDIKLLEEEKIKRQNDIQAAYDKAGEKSEKSSNKQVDAAKKVVTLLKKSAKELKETTDKIRKEYEDFKKSTIAGLQLEVDKIKEVLDFDKLSYNERINGIKNFYAAKNVLLEQQRKFELEGVEADSKEAAIINQKYDAQIRENKKNSSQQIKATNKEIIDASFELANAGLTSLQTINDIYFENKLKSAKGNAAEEEKIAKQQFKVNKAFQIGQAVMNGLQSVLAITSTAVDPTGITTGLRVAAQIALNVATIAKIAATQFTGAGSSAGGSQGASTPAISVPTTPSFNLFGQGNNMNVSAAQPTTTVSDPQGNILRVIAEVSETEISAVQARNRRYSNSAEL